VRERTLVITFVRRGAQACTYTFGYPLMAGALEAAASTPVRTPQSHTRALRTQPVLGHSVRGGISTSDKSSTSSGLTPEAERSAASGLRPLVGREHELERLEALLTTVRDGRSAAVFVRGEPGVGKSALLSSLIASASGFQVVRAIGVEGEVDLPYAGLQQLCRSMIDTIEVLPEPQRDALRVTFGLESGEASDRYLVGLAVLSLMSEVAAAKPLLCIVDDAHWLDPPTTGALAFVARRLGADSVALVMASRETVDGLEGVPEMHLQGLAAAEASALLDSVLIGRLDDTVRERFLAETRGNPLALIELHRALTLAQSTTGSRPQADGSLSGRIEESFKRRLEPLPDDTRRLLVLAAAEPLGDPLLLLRAAAQLDLGTEAADAAEEAGLLDIRERWSFPHPLVRSAVYQSATQRDRRRAHAALADATDPQLDPDRRAWHRAQATPLPDEDVAIELERTAARAKLRGGLGAAGAFLERAAMLTPDVDKRVERALEAAEVKYEAGAIDAAESLLRAVNAGQINDLQAARAERLHAQVSLSRVGPEKEAVLRLLAAADRLRQLDPSLGHAAHLEALRTGFNSGNREILSAIAQALDESPAPKSEAIVELLVRGWGQLLEQGFPAGTELLREATLALREKPQLEESDLPLLYFTEGITKSSWDLESWEMLARRTVQLARDSGALLMLPRALCSLAEAKVAAGEFSAAATAVAEAEAVSEVTGASLDWDSVWLQAWRFDETEALRRVAQEERRVAGSLPIFDYARALVYNGATRYEAALEAAQRSCDLHPLRTYSWALVELVEAASRCGRHEQATSAFQRLAERTRLVSTDWALGLEARSAALVSDDPAVAEPLYRAAVERLGHARTRPELARAHLVYGEWLRRENRRLDAREQLRTAHGMFSAIGIPGFAERARRELAASGESSRKRTDDTRADLTAQESQIARLASEGLTNPEIGAQLFLSPRTVEWHLRHVYPKLGISSRRELHTVLRLL
jgi:DNA-binding CsgD family transcriptional regulator